MKNNKMKNINNKKVILIAAGGTGGHIYPALSIINKKKFDTHLVITDLRGKGYFTKFLNEKNINILVHTHKVISPSNQLIINKLTSLFYFVISFIKSILLIIKYRPIRVLGFGGYPSVAPVLAAKIFGITTIIHEQNAVVGRANKLLSYISNILALSFENTKNVSNHKNFIYSGNPVRDEFFSIGKRKYELPNNANKFYVLIYGGSLGASFFSEHITSIICSMPVHIKKRIKIIQQVRKEDIDKVQNKYHQNKIDCEISVFFNNIFTKFKLAHLVITRAGGSTVAEIIASKKPAILVPLPNSLDNHQVENAQYIKNKGGWVFDEGKSRINELKKLINNLLINPHKLIEANKKLNKLSNKLSKLLNKKTSTVFLTDLIINQGFDKKEELPKSC